MFSNVGAANVITSKQAVCHIIGEHFIMLLVQGTGFYFWGKETRDLGCSSQTLKGICNY